MLLLHNLIWRAKTEHIFRAKIDGPAQALFWALASPLPIAQLRIGQQNRRLRQIELT